MLTSLHVSNHDVAIATKDGLDADYVAVGIGPKASEKFISEVIGFREDRNRVRLVLL